MDFLNIQRGISGKRDSSLLENSLKRFFKEMKIDSDIIYSGNVTTYQDHFEEFTTRFVSNGK